MTDAEIVKALECCMKSTIIDEYCDQCPYKIYNKYCMDKIFSDILDLINRQKAEIEKLKEIAESPILGKLVHVWKNEAIREFAEKLKAINKVCCINPNDLKEMNFIVDNLVKEMVGEE